MFLKIEDIWINLSHVETVTVVSEGVKFTFLNKTAMVFDHEYLDQINKGLNGHRKIAARLDSVSMSDPHDEILSLSEELLSDLSDPGTPGETITPF